MRFKFFKTIYLDNDVILGNSFSKIIIDFSHPDLIKDFSGMNIFTQSLNKNSGRSQYQDLWEKEFLSVKGKNGNESGKGRQLLKWAAYQKRNLCEYPTYGKPLLRKILQRPTYFQAIEMGNKCNEIPPFALGGFSAGARTCIGKHLVMIESKIGLIKFMKRYKKIEIPGQLKWDMNFFYTPQYFKSKLTITQDLKT